MEMEETILFTDGKYLLKGNYFLRVAKIRNHRHMMSAIKGVSPIVECN